MEGRRFLIVEWTVPDQGCPSLFEIDKISDHLFDPSCVQYFLYGLSFNHPRNKYSNTAHEW